MYANMDIDLKIKWNSTNLIYIILLYINECKFIPFFNLKFDFLIKFCNNLVNSIILLIISFHQWYKETKKNK